uniref:Poor homologous synapsis 1 PH domain-containing protein n=1 Tax=Aegilops tauschii subsp. strangulata TaxID=200361 RepID=A0A453RH43_AEGTS
MVAVGAGDDGWARLTSRSDAAEGQGRRQEWEVEFARYFASPLRDTSTPPPPPPPGVRYVTSATDCRPGAWLPAATPAALRVSRSSHPSAAPVLTVSVVGVVFVRTVSLPFPSPLLICVAAWCYVFGERD